jgi:hypothetical protein
MSDKSNVYLKDRRTGQLVEAILIDGVSKDEIEVADADWRKAFNETLAVLEKAGVPKSQWPQHSHWDWRKKYEVTADQLAFRILGVECQKQMQGLMLIASAGHYCRIPSQKEKDLVYVHFVATAPWNSPIVVKEPTYALVGRILIAAAVQISQAEEFAGRTGLHSLPQSESWYRDNCGMTDLGPDPNDRSKLRYFEMTPEQANRFLE